MKTEIPGWMPYGQFCRLGLFDATKMMAKAAFQIGYLKAVDIYDEELAGWRDKAKQVVVRWQSETVSRKKSERIEK